MSFYPRVEIIPGLFVGSAKDARDVSFLKTVSFVVNCTKEVPIMHGMKGIRVSVHDSIQENDAMLRSFPSVMKVIDQTLKSGNAVLVHCYAGMQRSCTIVAAYLMYMNAQYNRRLSAIHAMHMVKRRKPEAFEPAPTFLRALLVYESSFT